jgi:hypothetical protein
MLDTIVILIPWGYYHILDHNKFSPSTDGLGSLQFFVGTEFKNNPNKEEKEKHYYPRMTLYTTPFYAQTRVLKVECSIAKLINDGENINEYNQEDYMKAIETLQKRMSERGVMVLTGNLLNASVVALHASKNIPLTKGYTATLAIQELAKIDVTKRMDTNKADFRNEGYAYQFYTNSHAFVMYDKFEDITKPKGRAIDKDKTDKQLSIFNQVKNQMISHQLLRLEIRLSKKKYVNSTLVKLGYAPNPSLKDILSHELSKKILNQYWNEFFNENNRFVLDMDNNPLSLLKRTLHHDPNISIRQAMKAVAFNLIARDGGIRKLRTTIEAYRPDTDWHSIKKDLKIFESPPFPINTHGFIEDIERELSTFEPYKLNL